LRKSERNVITLGDNIIKSVGLCLSDRVEVLVKMPSNTKGIFCAYCDAKFTRKDNYKKHLLRFHAGSGVTSSTPVFICDICDETFCDPARMATHRQIHEKEVLDNENSLYGFIKLETAFRNVVCRWTRTFEEDVTNLDDGLEEVFEDAVFLLKYEKLTRKFYKVCIVAHAVFDKIDQDGNIYQTLQVPLRSYTHVVMGETTESDVVRKCFSKIRETCANFQSDGSGWIQTDLCYIDVEISSCRPIYGACGDHSVHYKRKKGIEISHHGFSDGRSYLNRNGDCLFRCVATHMLKKELGVFPNADQVCKYVTDKIRPVQMPVVMKDLTLFEDLNEHLDIAINVVEQDEDGFVFPVRASKRIHAKNNIVVMLTKRMHAGSQRVVSHYVYVPDPKLLFAKRTVTPKTGKTNTRQQYLCYNCFHLSWNRSAYEIHVGWCHLQNSQRVKVPGKGQVDEFDYSDKGNKMKELPFFFFYDFECIQAESKVPCPCKPIGASPAKKRKVECTHKTVYKKEHKAYSYALVLVNRNHEVLEEVTYAGMDCVEKFVEKVIELEEKYLGDLAAGGRPMENTQTPRIQKIIQETKECCLCKYPLLMETEDGKTERIVRHHDHVSGDFVGMAHDKCNLRFREKLRLIGFCHNFSGYDSHLIIKALHLFDKERVKNINAIPLNTEKVKTMSFNKVILLDSAAFLSESLEKLVNVLNVSEHRYPLMRQKFHDEEELKLLLRKGVFPYDFVTYLERLKECKELPEKKHFHNDLLDEDISDDDYEHAKAVFQKFKMKDMLDYSNLYNLTDCYLLAEVVMQFRKDVLKDYQIEMGHYYSLPHMAKDIMFKSTATAVEFMSDLEMIAMVRKGVRGGLSFVGTRHAKADKDHTITALDFNSLYPCAMQFKMPVRGYQWMKEEELKDFDVQNQVSNESEEGYIFEVTLDYPRNLHLKHSSFPLLPVRKTVTLDDLSPYSKECLRAIDGRTMYKSDKLTTTFERREKYVIHGMNLKLALELGLELVEIHRGIKFYQADFIRPFIDMCAAKRAAAKTDFQKRLYKLLMNSTYGKLLQDSTKHFDVKFVRSRERFLEYTTSHLFKSAMILDEEFVMVFQKKKEVTMQQNWAIGFTILELSKYVVQESFYKSILPSLNGRANVLLTDTDSFYLLSECKDSDEVMEKLGDLADTSNYPKDHPLYDPSNRNVPGKLKNEMAGTEIVELVGLSSKCYSYTTKSGKNENKLKGVKKSVTKHMGIRHYKACLKRVCEVRVKQMGIMSKKHTNMLVESEKRAFSSFDGKRYLHCSIHSSPYGSKLIEYQKKFSKDQCLLCARKSKDLLFNSDLKVDCRIHT